MAPPIRARPLRKDALPSAIKASKPITFTESGRINTNLVPNIHSISWSPTGSMLASAMNKSIRVWNPERPDVKNSTEMRDPSCGTPVAHKDSVERVVFNPRSEALLASIGKDSLVKLWDVRLPSVGAVLGMGGPVGGGGKGGTTSKAGEHNLGDSGLFLTWHPNGTEMLVGTHKDIVQALDVRRMDIPMLELPTTTATSAGSNSGTLKYELIAHDRTPVKDEGFRSWNQMAFSNSGRELLCTTYQGSVKIFDYPSLEPLHTLRAHSTQTYCVQNSPTGQYIAIGCQDSLITLWDTSNWMCTHVLTSQVTSVRELSFSFDGAYLIAGATMDARNEANEKGLHIYHVDTGETIHTIETAHTVRDASWHPLRYAIAYSGDSGGLKVAGNLAVT